MFSTSFDLDKTVTLAKPYPYSSVETSVYTFSLN